MRGIAVASALVVSVLAALALALCVVPERSGLLVTVVNSSTEPLTGLAISTGETTKVVDAIRSGQSVEVRTYPSAGENTLTLSDANGRRYILLGYFEGNPDGSVVVTVYSVGAGELRGRVVTKTDYPGTEGAHELQAETP